MSNATTTAAAETAPAFAPIDVSIDDGPLTPPSEQTRGWRVDLWLDPEDRDVTVYRRIGVGMPAHVWHDRSLFVDVPATADGASVRQIVEANLDLVAAIFDLYQGSEWDGHNHVGRWGGGDEGADRDALVAQLEAKLAEAPTYWDASDWVAPAWSELRAEVRSALLSGRDLNDLAAQWAREAANEGALVDASDLRENFDKAAEELRGDEDDEDVWVVRLGAEPKAQLLDGAELPEAEGFGETWRVVEGNSDLDAIIKARALDGAGAEAALVAILGAWVEEKVAPLAAHLGREIPA